MRSSRDSRKSRVSVTEGAAADGEEDGAATASEVSPVELFVLGEAKADVKAVGVGVGFPRNNTAEIGEEFAVVEAEPSPTSGEARPPPLPSSPPNSRGAPPDDGEEEEEDEATPTNGPSSFTAVCPALL